MHNTLISILTPFKNTAQYITECIESIRNQSHQNWELIIVNDHSTDESRGIVLTFAEIDHRIKLFENSGHGIIDALRLAYSKSGGTYITRMDSDDIMHKRKLEIMLNDLQIHGKQHIALGLVKYFKENGIGNGYAIYESWLNNLTRSGNNYSEIYKECVIPSPCWMIHRDDFELCGAFSSNRYPEDYDLTFRYYKYKMYCIPSISILHYWRDYSTRASRTHEHYAGNNFLELKINYFIELNYDSKRPLIIWGAGQKGKAIAKLLQQKQITFTWVCDNPKKIGKHIYNELLYSYEELGKLTKPQSIISVANKEAQTEIQLYFKTLKMKAMIDYYFFC